jgi:hypothetical protein
MAFGISGGAYLMAGTALAGGYMSSKAAGNAADQQAQSGRESLALQKEMFDKNIALQEPFRQNGLNASNRLQQLMGLSSGTASASGVPGASGGLSAEQLRAELLGQYTTTAAPNPADGANWTIDNDNRYYTPQPGEQTIDENGLQAAIQARMSQQAQPSQQSQQQGDPAYGSLAKSFTMADFIKDPGYEFRMTEGQKGVENSAAARGGLLSGAAMKAMQKYGQDFASNEFQNSYNRFNNDQTTQFNRLSGMAGSGQTAATQQGNAATNYGQRAGDTMTGIGNAQAAGTVGSANAWSNGIGGAVNNYQSNQLMDMIRNPGSGASSWSPVNDGGYSVGQGSAYGGNRRGM